MNNINQTINQTTIDNNEVSNIESSFSNNKQDKQLTKNQAKILKKEARKSKKQEKILAKQAKIAAKKLAEEKMCAEILLARQQKKDATKQDKNEIKKAKKQIKADNKAAKILENNERKQAAIIARQIDSEAKKVAKQAKIAAKQAAEEKMCAEILQNRQLKIDALNHENEQIETNELNGKKSFNRKKANKEQAYENKLLKIQQANQRQEEKQKNKLAKKQAKIDTKNIAKQAKIDAKIAKASIKKAAKQAKIDAMLENIESTEIVKNKMLLNKVVDLNVENSLNKNSDIKIDLTTKEESKQTKLEKKELQFTKHQAKLNDKSEKKRAKIAARNAKYQARKLAREEKIFNKVSKINFYQEKREEKRLVKQKSKFVNREATVAINDVAKNNDSIIFPVDQNMNNNIENEKSLLQNKQVETAKTKEQLFMIEQASKLGMQEAQNNILHESKIDIVSKQSNQKMISARKQAKINDKIARIEARKIAKANAIQAKIDIIKQKQAEIAAKKQAKIDAKEAKIVARIDAKNNKSKNNTLKQNNISSDRKIDLNDAINNKTASTNKKSSNENKKKQKTKIAKKQAKIEAKLAKKQAKIDAKKAKKKAKYNAIKKQERLEIKRIKDQENAAKKIELAQIKQEAKLKLQQQKEQQKLKAEMVATKKAEKKAQKEKEAEIAAKKQSKIDAKKAKKQAKIEAKAAKHEAKKARRKEKFDAKKKQDLLEVSKLHQKSIETENNDFALQKNNNFNQLDKDVKIISGKELRKDESVVEMINISKTFLGGKIIANQNVNIEIKYNEIHAICGENGAGKSTLMSILFGLYKQDSGEIFINGKLAKFKNASDATKDGLGMVHQHFKLVQVYSLLDNIILGAETTKFGFLNKKSSIEKINKICADYNLNINLKTRTNVASVGQQQRAEIIKLLYRGAEILIFDEPTAVLSDNEIQGFLNILLELKRQGKTIILISHKLNEVKQIADRITILRKGTSVGTYGVNQITEEKIVELMVGNKIVFNVNTLDFSDKTQNLFTIDKLICKKISNNKLIAVKNLSLSVNPGEILGIAGIEGNGQSELALAIAGLHKIDRGSMVLNKNGVTINVTNMSPKQRSKVGIAHVPEDRHKYGLILDETVSYNLISNQVNSNLYNKMGFLRMKEAGLNATNLCAKFDIKGANRGKALARSLSGGNQQKIVVAREMSKHHDLIVLVQPTRGLDVKAANFIHDKIIDEAKNGKAIILISYELDEIIKVCSKIAVMDQGQIVYHGSKKDINRQQIGKFLLRADLKKSSKAKKKGATHE